MQRQSVVESMDRSDVRAGCVCSAAGQTNLVGQVCKSWRGEYYQKRFTTSSIQFVPYFDRLRCELVRGLCICMWTLE